MIRAVNEVGLNAKMFGGAMVGSQLGSLKSQLGPMLNGLVNYDFWLPVGAYATPEAKAFIAKYQARVADSGADTAEADCQDDERRQIHACSVCVAGDSLVMLLQA